MNPPSYLSTQEWLDYARFLILSDLSAYVCDYEDIDERTVRMVRLVADAGAEIRALEKEKAKWLYVL